MNRALIAFCGLSAFVLTMILMCPGTGYQPTGAQDPERARFMLECAYDWNLSPHTCREILKGDDPPVPAPEYDEC